MIEKIGHYQIISELGRGGMGIVLKARDPSLDRIVAIKILSKQIVEDETLISRFKREAKSAASLNHPNIIQIYFIGEEEGQHYFAMEYVEGESVSQLIRRRGKLAPHLAAQILRQVAAGLAVAHDIKIIHRDIKPANIMINPHGLVKIADFGIAFVPDPDQKLTVTGAFMGTPGYISPEICLGQPTDHRSDIFSLGIVYFEMLAGKQPFQADSPFGLMHKVLTAELPDIRQLNDEVDPESVAILAKMVEKRPEDRFQTCHELADALDAGPTKNAKGYLAAGLGLHQAEAQTNRAKPAWTDAADPSPPFIPERKTQVSPARGNPGSNAAPPLEPARHTLMEAPANPSKNSLGSNPESGSQPLRTVVIPPPPAPVKKASKLPWLIAAILIPALLLGGVVIGPKLWDQISTAISAPPSTAQIKPAIPQPKGNDIDPAPGGEPLVFEYTDPPTQQGSDPLRPAGSPDQPDPGLQDPVMVASTPPVGGQGSAAPGASSPTTVAESLNVPPTIAEASHPSTKASKGDDVALASPDVSPPETPRSKSSSPRKIPPGDPNVVVISVGDPLLAEPVELALEEYLGQDKIRLMDEDHFSELSDFIGDTSIDLDPLRKSAYALGGDVLVLVEIKDAGNREVRAINRSSTVYTARIKVRCILLSSNRGIGSTFQDQVEYNNLTATRAAEKSMRKFSDEIADLLKGL